MYLFFQSLNRLNAITVATRSYLSQQLNIVYYTFFPVVCGVISKFEAGYKRKRRLYYCNKIL